MASDRLDHKLIVVAARYDQAVDYLQERGIGRHDRNVIICTTDADERRLLGVRLTKDDEVVRLRLTDGAPAHRLFQRVHMLERLRETTDGE